MKKNIKKICFAVIGGIMIFSAMNTAFAEERIMNSTRKVYKNISGDFSMSDTYYYSSEDKKTEKHTAVFVLDSNEVKVDGKTIPIDAAPYINDGRTMLPLRAVTELLKTFENNVNISWNSSDKKVIVVYQDNEVVFTVGSDVYTFDGISKTMSGGIPEIKNDRVFIPVREIAQALDLEINWNPSKKMITITN